MLSKMNGFLDIFVTPHLYRNLNIKMSSQKLQKSLDRFKERILNGSFYEAEQTIVSISNRYVFSKNYDSAIELIYSAIIILVDHKKFNEGASLYLKLLDILLEVNGGDERDQLNKLETILKSFPETDSNIGNLAKETLKFERSNSSEFNFARVNEILGIKLLNSGKSEFVNLSEQFLITSSDEETVKQLVNFELKTMEKNHDNDNFALYVSRLVISYLFSNNIKCSKLAIELMLNNNQLTGPLLDVKGSKIFEVEDSDVSELAFNKKLINYLQLLIGCVEKGNGKHFQLLYQNYGNVITHFDGLTGIVNKLGEIHFNVSVVRKQGNVLQSMMGNFLGGSK